jgi:rare lipoprotein A
MMKFFSIVLLVSILQINAIGQVGYVQEGKASFYADKFEGRTTASGERYSHAKSTCAHLTLPFGTLVKVTNTANNQSVVVRVNDRGPFVPDRIIDLSRSAAEKLGIAADGLAQVRLEVIDEAGNIVAPQASAPAPKPTQNPQTTTPEPQHFDKLSASPQSQPQYSSDYELYEVRVAKQEKGGFTVQIKSYKEVVNLLRITEEIQSSLKKEVRIQVATVNGERIYRVMVGKFSTRAEAENFRDIAAKNYPDCFVVELK